jgi:hypothetical protein
MKSCRNKKKYKTDSKLEGDHSKEKQPWSMKPPPGHGAEKRCRNGRKAYEKKEKTKRIRKKRK